MALTVRILFPVLIVYLGCDHCSDCRPEKKVATGRNSIKRVLDDYGMYKMEAASGFDKAPVCGRTVVFKDELRRQVNEDNSSADYIDDDPDLDKIIGGEFVTYGEVPWMVNIESKGMHICGGSIISEFWVVTAAHCVSKGTKDMYGVTVGDHTLWAKDDFEFNYFIDMIVVNERYNKITFDLDIALIKIKSDKLGRGIKYNDFVQPICLAYATEEPKGYAGIKVAGWGNPNKHGDESKVLKEAELDVYEYDECKEAYHKVITPNMFCIGVRGGVPGPCPGDSGGPAYYNTVAGNVLYGVISFGGKCGDPKKPPVCSNIANIRGWIDSQIRKNSVGNQGLMPVRRKPFTKM